MHVSRARSTTSLGIRPDAPRRWALAAATSVAAGSVAGWWIPRGPTTTVEAVVGMVAAIGVGFLVGRLIGSRWALLCTPVTFAVCFELVRLRIDGPTVDGIRLDGIYGVIMSITGRGSTPS